MKARINSTVAVPLEMKELYRQIQRAEQLTVSINLQVSIAACTSYRIIKFQKNLQDSSIGRDLLRAINGLCTDEKQFPVIDDIRLSDPKNLKSLSD